MNSNLGERINAFKDTIFAELEEKISPFVVEGSNWSIQPQLDELNQMMEREIEIFRDVETAKLQAIMEVYIYTIFMIYISIETNGGEN